MKGKISKKQVDGLSAEDNYLFLWDTEVRGFGLKVTPAGKKIFILQYRVPGRKTPKRFTIGVNGSPWTAETARREAIRLLGLVSTGEDPGDRRDLMKARSTVADLCEKYLAEGCLTKKASTIATDRGRIKRHIIPLIGNQFVEDVTSNDVRRFMADVANGKTAVDVQTGKWGRARVTGGKGTAARTVGLLGGIFSFAVECGLRTDNPVRGIKRYKDKRKERFLTNPEMAELGRVLRELEQAGTEAPVALNSIRLLIYTGCRKSEILSLKWSEVDFQFNCLNLEDSKTGEKTVLLGAPALELLTKLPRKKGCPFVFPALKGDGHYVGLPKAWLRIKKKAGLHDVRLHDLRHSFVTTGIGSGVGLSLIGKLVGHKDTKTTDRYAHLADDPARVAINRISADLEQMMAPQPKATKNIIHLER